MRVLLVPGGFWDPTMTADRFWERSGVAAGLRANGHEPVLVERRYDSPSWGHDVPAVLAQLAEPTAEATIDALLLGETLRGTTDAQLRTISNLCRVIPSEPANLTHQSRTWQRLVELGAERLAGCPEPPSPGFADHLETLLTELDAALS